VCVCLCVDGHAGGVKWALVLLLLVAHAVLVVAPPRVPSVGEWAGIRAMKFLKAQILKSPVYFDLINCIYKGTEFSEFLTVPLLQIRPLRQRRVRGRLH
jgi:hypothetical protein